MFLFEVKWKVWSAVCATKCETIMFYILKHSHLTHAQIPRNMHSETLQTTIKEAQVRSYLLSARNPPVVRVGVPLWFPSCLCPCECCWWNPPSPADGRPGSLAALSMQQKTDWIRAWAVGTAATVTFWKVTHKAALSSFIYFHMHTNLADCIFIWFIFFAIYGWTVYESNVASRGMLISEMGRANSILAWVPPFSSPRAKLVC